MAYKIVVHFDNPHQLKRLYSLGHPTDFSYCGRSGVAEYLFGNARKATAQFVSLAKYGWQPTLTHTDK